MKRNMIQFAVPVASVLIFLSAYLFLDGGATGLVVHDSNLTEQMVDADVLFETREGEVIPPDALIEVWIDNRKDAMTVAEFIRRTGKEYEIKQGELLEFDFMGKGFSGNHLYNLTLADFDIDRNIGPGEHRFLTRIVYRGQLLYEKENHIMISG